MKVGTVCRNLTLIHSFILYVEYCKLSTKMSYTPSFQNGFFRDAFNNLFEILKTKSLKITLKYKAKLTGE